MNKYSKILHDLLKSSQISWEKTFITDIFKDKEIVAYGIGECFHWFEEIVMNMNGFKPVAIIDKVFKENTIYKNIPSYSPDNYILKNEKKKKTIAVICVGNEDYYDEIEFTLCKIGFEHIILLRDIYEVHNPFNLPDELSKEGIDFYTNNQEKIFSAFDLFNDELSIEIYVNSLISHITRKPVPLKSSARNEQYFPKDIVMKKGYSRFINCGAYNGDTIRQLNTEVGKVDEIICFEPEPYIFQDLSQFLNTNQNNLADKIFSYPCAVYKNDSKINFIKGHGLGSRISDLGNYEVQTVSLDNALPGYKPSFINMDIEGVEPAALIGAEKMIINAKPDLGICVYHSPDHLWEIPLYLNSLNLGYKFYLRNYTSFFLETVLYATCE